MAEPDYELFTGRPAASRPVSSRAVCRRMIGETRFIPSASLFFRLSEPGAMNARRVYTKQDFGVR